MHERAAEFYDQFHIETNVSDAGARYYRLFRKVVTVVCDHGSRAILEVGCGSGFLAQMLLEQHKGDYRGFDFSQVAVRNAIRRTGRPDLFFLGDALNPRCYSYDYDTIVCTEVLEHIDADLDVIRTWRDGTWCVCTVPNFEADGHVRYFSTSREVAARYGELIDINAVIKTPRPIIPDGRLSSYLRKFALEQEQP